MFTDIDKEASSGTVILKSVLCNGEIFRGWVSSLFSPSGMKTEGCESCTNTKKVLLLPSTKS